MASFVFALATLTVVTTASYTTEVDIVPGSGDKTSFIYQEAYEYQLNMKTESSNPRTSLTIKDSVIPYHYFLKFVNLYPSLEMLVLKEVDVTGTHEGSRETLETVKASFTVLLMEHCKMNDMDFFHLTTVALKNLKSIEVKFSRLESINNDEQGFGRECSKNANVLLIDFHKIESKELKASRFFVTLMNSFTKLSELSLFYFAVGGGELDRLFGHYPDNADTMDTVTELALIKGEITDSNFVSLLAKIPNVEKLYITDNPISAGFENVSENQKLTHITANSMPMGISGTGFVNLISHCPLLMEINVSVGPDQLSDDNLLQLGQYFEKRRSASEPLQISMGKSQGKDALMKFCNEKVNAQKRCTCN